MIYNDLLHDFNAIDEVRVTHMALELEVSFDEKTLSGCVILSLEKVNPGANVLVSFYKFYTSLIRVRPIYQQLLITKRFLTAET